MITYALANGLTDRHLVLRLSAPRGVCLIVDASESATAAWNDIAQFALQLWQVLPATVTLALYALGNPERQTISGRPEDYVRLRAENAQRASLVGPIFRALSSNEPPAIVVLGSGLIFDLEDWVNTPLLEEAWLVNFGESLQPLALGVRELQRPNVHQLAASLHKDVARVSIGANSWLPYVWSNAHYRWQDGMLEAAEGSFDVSVSCLVPAAIDVSAVLTWTNQTQRRVNLEPGQEPAPPEWVTLSAAEALVFRQAQAHQPFSCLVCGREHSWDTLMCLDGPGLLEDSIYPSLPARQGFALLWDDGQGVQARSHACNVLRLGPASAAIATDHAVQCYYYDPGQGGWRPTNMEFVPYTRIPSGLYAIYL